MSISDELDCIGHLRSRLDRFKGAARLSADDAHSPFGSRSMLVNEKDFQIIKKCLQFFENINWNMLREQKEHLVCITTERNKYINGIIHLIDALQDTVVDCGDKTEEQVFGKLE